jgi:hypothetical protein
MKNSVARASVPAGTGGGQGRPSHQNLIPRGNCQNRSLKSLWQTVAAGFSLRLHRLASLWHRR